MSAVVSLNLVYSAKYIASRGYIQGMILLIDDWIKRDRFIFIGWSGILLFPAIRFPPIFPLETYIGSLTSLWRKSIQQKLSIRRPFLG